MALVAVANALLIGIVRAQQVITPEPPPAPPKAGLIDPAGGVLGFQRGQADGLVSLATLAHLRGARINHLVGQGLAVGLQNTGDTQQTQFTIFLFLNVLKRSGVTLPSSVNPTNIQVRNMAGVMVTADLPAFARVGSRLDVLVSTMGDARSLQGGTLLMTPLHGTDGRVYAVAQGPVTIEGYFAGAGGGASARKNFQTAGQIPGGATVEREVSNDFTKQRTVEIEIDDPNAGTAVRAADAIANQVREAHVGVKDPGTVEVELPDWMSPVSFAAMLNDIRIAPTESDRVVVDERTGTIVVGGRVTVGKAAISHGNLTVTIEPKYQISQPGPFSTGTTVVAKTPKLKVDQEQGQFFVIPDAASVEQIAETLNAVGTKPGDVIAIFEGLRAAGALHGQLIVR